jgi:predicted AlkP superfamily pyrophosphatase or phosphodiesterase
MSRGTAWRVITATFMSVALPGTPTVPADSTPSVVMILIDGARWDVASSPDAPNIRKLAARGMQGEMIPVWPSVSAPNHWALATGLYPIHNGVYDNVLYDPAMHAIVPYGRAAPGDKYFQGEPIWATVARQGHISGVIGYWAGVDNSPVSPEKPSYFIPYVEDEEKYVPDDPKRIAASRNLATVIVNLLDQSDLSGSQSRPILLAAYIGFLDETEHEKGVGSPETRATLRDIDKMVGDIVDGLALRKLSDKVTIILVGDHGHVNIGENDQPYFIDDVIDVGTLQTPLPVDAKQWASVPLWPEPGQEEDAFTRLSTLGPHLHVYRNGRIPARLHCCDAANGPPIMLLADPGWFITTRAAFAHGEAQASTHGYDNAVQAMHALFVAAGPGIRSGVTVGTFENVDVYSLVSGLLGVRPAPTDGSIQPLCVGLVRPTAECGSNH